MSQPISLLEYALENIRNKILNGEYPEGAKLTTKRVADELSISQTPVKDAFNRLVSEHLLEPIPRRGFQVSTFSTDYLRNIVDARKLIELYISEKAVCYVDKHPDTMEKLSDMLDEMRTNSGEYAENKKEWEVTFHITIASLCENEFLIDVYRQLWNIMVVYYIHKLPDWPNVDKYNTPSEHENMYRCLKEKDSAGLRNEFSKHISRMEKNMCI